MVTLTVELQFLSDWGVGTGTGRTGDLDSVIAKDELSLPMVPGKTLTGVLRSACEQAALALDDGGPAWQPVVEWLFGSQSGGSADPTRRPVPAALSVRAAYLPAETRDFVRRASRADALLLQAAAVTVRPNTAIDDATGTVAVGSLRFSERGRAGQVLTAEADVDCGTSLPPDVATLLVCGSVLLERLGGRRRRGSGRCRVRITAHGGAPGPLAPDWTAQPQARPPVRPAAAGPASSTGVPTDGAGADADQTGLLRVGVYELRCVTPVVAARGVVGNVIESHDFVPGSLLLPIVSAALGDNGPTLVGTCRLVVTDATPAPAGVRLVPVARCWQAPKGTVGGLHNALAGQAAARTVPVRSGWVDPSRAPGRIADIHRVALAERAHAVIDDDLQRPVDGLFVAQAIPAGTLLRFEVWAPPGTSLRLPHRNRIGRAKKDDYGLVEITPVDAPPLASAPVDAAPADPAGPGPGGDGEPHRLTVWLVSDVLVDDGRRRHTTRVGALADLVAQRLGVRRLPEQPMDAFADVRRHQGWTATAGLPRPSLAAVAAGTVLRFAVDRAPAAAALATVEREGVGDRRAEGFGRVLIDAPALSPALPPAGDAAVADAAHGAGGDDPDAPSPTPPTPPATPAEWPDHETGWASPAWALWEAASRLWIAQACIDAATSDTSAAQALRGLTMSQLGTLREAVLTTTTGAVPLPARLAGHLDGQDEPRGILRALLSGTDPQEVWRQLAAHDWAEQPANADAARHLWPRARQELLLRLLVAAQRAKQAGAGPDEAGS